MLAWVLERWLEDVVSEGMNEGDDGKAIAVKSSIALLHDMAVQMQIKDGFHGGMVNLQSSSRRWKNTKYCRME